MARVRKKAATTPSQPDGERSLVVALNRLNGLLSVAVEQQARRLGPASLMDPWLGMHLEAADVERLLAHQGHRALTADRTAAGMLAKAMREVGRMASMADALNLNDVDLAALLIALAPDVDLGYERIYGYLQDDITHKRPCLDFIANLLAVDASQRMDVCTRFSMNAPLIAHDVLVRSGDGARSPLAQDWRVDPIWRVWIMEGELADALETPPARTRRCTLDSLAVEPTTRMMLEQACRLAATAPLRLWLHGEHGAGKYDAACAVAAQLHRELVPLDLRDVDGTAGLVAAIERTGRAAALFGGLLYVHGVAKLEQRDPQLVRALVAGIADVPCHVVLSSVAPPPPVHAGALPLLRVELRFPSAAVRRSIWEHAMRQVDADVGAQALDVLAARFSLSSAQIHQAAVEARMSARAENVESLSYRDIASAVRRQCGSELSRMASRITPRADFANLVVPAEVRNQLREICARVATRDRVAHDWAEDSVHARVTGITALFVGPSGTGKTLSAEALTNGLGLDLYRIDLAGVVSKYIGETEKNLDRVFAAAAHANAVLFFDEAEALFGKRSEVKDAHDRYANIEVAYLLQKMEQFDGLAILATNLKQNLDEAFTRRLTFTVTFPFPEEAERHLLWENLWPPRAPRADDVDLAWFAREFRLSGGNIRNTVMAAAHLAAADGQIITRSHLLHATRREYQKLGKNLVHPPETAA